MKKLKMQVARKAGFTHRRILRKGEPQKQTITYLKQKSSFIVAALSLVAFVVGNMVGQHGWYAFLKAALGQYDDSLITYTGTVSPIALVPDYSKWNGGDNGDATYASVPSHLLVPLPMYSEATERLPYDAAPAGDIFSVGYMGAYDTGAQDDGSHVGVDIRVPEGTPVRAVANGIVVSVAEDRGGFGYYIVIRHPHMPDPANPAYETVLYSGYAHLSQQMVQEGDVVTKGQQIGRSGKTGYATGPHLHFQMDRDSAPWHPYWPFSYSEAKSAGLDTTKAINVAFMGDRARSYTVNPVLYVQKNYAAAKFKLEIGESVAVRSSSSKARTLSLKESTAQRKAQRMVARGITAVAVQQIQQAASSASSAATTQQAAEVAALENPSVVQVQTVAVEPQEVPSPAVATLPVASGPVVSVEIEHDGLFEGRTWEKVRLVLKDAAGSTVSEEKLTGKLYMRTAYGEAEFKPAILSKSDFKDGVAEIEMLPRGARTVVVLVEPLKSMSSPMEFAAQ